MFSQMSPIAADPSASPSAAERLNAVSLSGPQMAAALDVLALSPVERRDDTFAQAMALQAYACDAGFADEALAAAAIHARVSALAKWTADHDPLRQSDALAVMEAAAHHPLVETKTGIGFEGAAFQEMILFIEELPW